MSVGDYVRTKFGYICKIVNINEFREPSIKYGVDASYLKDFMFIGDDDIKLAKEKLIDLIEVGDYVNGHRVLDIAQAPEKVLYLNDISQKCALIPVCDYQIKSIVTKEQFESMEYKVGE